ncbi:MAG TPA: phospho-N-acetylmuramoyl-pentapeptide-transferase [Nitrospinota bacterium]|nr:phospho-N-acetylmuramoyl-pentapeptide-transferase [Nitrospinota bacterium]
MLYHLLYPLHAKISFLNVFKYITFRTSYAILTALLISLLLGPFVIKKLMKYQIGESIRSDGPPSHLSKEGTPTMGGMLIIVSLVISTLLWVDLLNKYAWLVLISIIGFGLIGFWDDYLKVIKRRENGLRVKEKFLVQFLLGLGIALFLYLDPATSSFSSKLFIPFFKKINPDLGWWYILFAVFVIVGTSNAVNLTDGLDGLAIGPIIIATLTYVLISYLSGHVKFAGYLNITYIKGAGELSIFCGSIIGASLGFLWFNSYPAQMFMGNVGSLALGGALGTVAVITKHELVLIIVGGIFVIETLSVIVQVLYFKVTGKRVFRMAPLHHHFEEIGWAEPKVIVRFWIIAIMLALLSLSTLKLR